MSEYMDHWEHLYMGAGKTPNTPEELWELACDYFRWCNENPIQTKRTLQTGKEAGKKMEIEHPRPFSIKALCLHCGIFEDYLQDCRAMEDKSNMYYIVASKILYLIYVQNTEYAMVDVYNPMFTQKMLNMDKPEENNNGIRIEIVQGLPKLLTTEEEILKNLESENPDVWNESK